MDWLALPGDLLAAFFDMLEPLRAREALAGAAVAACGSGRMKSHAVRSLLLKWERLAGRADAPAAKRRETLTAEALAAMGIGSEVRAARGSRG